MPAFAPASQGPAKADYQFEGWLTLRTPLLHGDSEALGNVRLFRSQKVVCGDGVVRRVPVYSGNAFRGMLRDIAARQLMQALDVQLPPPVFHFLTSGGSLTAGGGTASIDVDHARGLRNTIPMVGVWGGGVGNQILEGKLTVLQLTPICQEVLHLLPAYCRQAPSAALSMRDLRQMEFGTRRDDSKRERDQAYLAGGQREREVGEVATAMIYESEALVPGTCLRFGFALRDATRAEWTCFLAALVGWLEAPFLGGRSAAGYGEVSAPSLYRSRRELTFHQREGGLVDLRAPLATVESAVDMEDRLALAAGEVMGEYTADVEARRADLMRALGEVA